MDRQRVPAVSRFPCVRRRVGHVRELVGERELVVARHVDGPAVRGELGGPAHRQQCRADQVELDLLLGAGRELLVPLLTSSLTTAAAFLPIYLAKSSAGEYTGVIFLVVTIALLSSWVLALTTTPLLCVWFLRVRPGGAEGDPLDTPFYRRYRGALVFALTHRAAPGAVHA